REPRLASIRVEELYVLLERHGAANLRTAIAAACAKGRLSVAAVRVYLPKATEPSPLQGQLPLEPRSRS
ncbi:MAG: hypothetical protein ACYCWW_17660, partial [Deltaproteobacteria bacterium]